MLKMFSCGIGIEVMLVTPHDGSFIKLIGKLVYMNAFQKVVICVILKF